MSEGVQSKRKSAVSVENSFLPAIAKPASEEQADEFCAEGLGMLYRWNSKYHSFSVSSGDSAESLARKAERWRLIIQKDGGASKESQGFLVEKYEGKGGDAFVIDNTQIDVALSALGMIGQVWNKGETIVPDLVVWIEDPSFCREAIRALGRMGANAWSALPSLEHVTVSTQKHHCSVFAKEAVEKIKRQIGNPKKCDRSGSDKE